MKKLSRFLASALACISLAACLPLGEKTVGKTAVAEGYSSVPQGYQKELNEAMFWEKEDTVNADGTLVPNEGIWIYNYCPTIMQVDDYTRYAYYCSNKNGDENAANVHFNVRLDIDGDEIVTDHIAARKGILYNGEWYWSEKKYVLSPVRGSWYEGEHLCDPNVIQGDFKYNGTKYKYLMAYLVTSYRQCIYNHICLAVANDPMGPWKKCDDINPFVEHITDEYVDFAGNTIPAVPEEDLKRMRLWGYGQPSMISVDKKGKILMFYSAIKPMYAADSNGFWMGAVTQLDRWDLSDLNNPKYDFGIPFVAPAGLKKNGQQIDTMTNGDYAYDPAMNRIYSFYDASWTKEEGTTGAMLAFVENESKSEQAQIGDVFRDFPKEDWGTTGIAWRTLAFVKPTDLETFPNAHNVAIIRDGYGWVLDPLNIELAITGCKTSAMYEIEPGSWEEKHIWTYRVLRKTVKVQCRNHKDYTGDYKCDICGKAVEKTDAPQTSAPPQTSESAGGCFGAIGGGSAAALIAFATTLLIRKKNKENEQK